MAKKKPSAKDREAARAKRKGYMKERKGFIDKMKAASKAGKKDEAKQWRDKAMGVADKARGQADIMILSRSAAGRKKIMDRGNKAMADKVAVWQKRLDEATKKKVPAAKIARIKKAIGVVTDRQKKRKTRYANLLKK
jgi:hypothetical protein